MRCFIIKLEKRRIEGVDVIEGYENNCRKIADCLWKITLHEKVANCLMSDIYHTMFANLTLMILICFVAALGYKL